MTTPADVPQADGGAPSPVTPQPAAAYSFVEPLIASRVEILSTLLIDSAMLALAAFTRAFFLWITDGVLGHEADSWPLKVLEGILDFGLLGTVMAVTVFDLAKRVRSAYWDFRS